MDGEEAHRLYVRIEVTLLARKGRPLTSRRKRRDAERLSKSGLGGWGSALPDLGWGWGGWWVGGR